jgi:hypothetical protein
VLPQSYHLKAETSGQHTSKDETRSAVEATRARTIPPDSSQQQELVPKQLTHPLVSPSAMPSLREVESCADTSRSGCRLSTPEARLHGTFDGASLETAFGLPWFVDAGLCSADGSKCVRAGIGDVLDGKRAHGMLNRRQMGCSLGIGGL